MSSVYDDADDNIGRATKALLVRVLSGKVESQQRFEDGVRDAPNMQNDGQWNCVNAYVERKVQHWRRHLFL